MKILSTILCFLTTFLLSATSENFSSVRVSGTLQLELSDNAGHQNPYMEFFRSLERVVRNSGKFHSSNSSRELTIMLSTRQAPGTWRFISSADYGKDVLVIPSGLRQLLASPEVGRTVVTAMIQSNLGYPPAQPLPPEACWIADGLWAEFVQREIQIFPVLHFTYLENLRKLAEDGYKLQFYLPQLMPPPAIQLNSPVWTLYTQRAQLMLEVSSSLAGKHGNLLKDYIFLQKNNKLKPDEAFAITFAEAAYKKVYGLSAPASQSVADRRKLGYRALEKLALQNLFSGISPMAPGALLKRFDKLCEIEYVPQNQKNRVKAQLSDLPYLINKHESCAAIPSRKIAELNDFAVLLPTQLLGDLVQLINVLAKLDGSKPERSSRQIKENYLKLREKLFKLHQTDLDLEFFEKQNLPQLYWLRYKLNTVTPDPPLPENIKKYIDEQQRKLESN